MDQELVNKTNNLHYKNFDKTLGPEKCLVVLKFPFITSNSDILERKIKQLWSEKLFMQQKSIENYHFSCFCKVGYIGLTIRKPLKKWFIREFQRV